MNSPSFIFTGAPESLGAGMAAEPSSACFSQILSPFRGPFQPQSCVQASVPSLLLTLATTPHP